MKKVRGYVFSRQFNSSTVPQRVQNIVIRDFCYNHNLQYLLSATEYSMPNTYKILESVLSKIKEIDGIVFYSIFQLPNSSIKRNIIYKKFLNNNKFLYFAAEDVSVKSKKGFEEIEKMIKINKSFNKYKEKSQIKYLKNFYNDKRKKKGS